MDAGKFYLSREGKTLGPYTESQLKEMKTSGKIWEYSWFWDSKTPSWTAVHPMPPLPGLPESMRSPSVSLPAVAAVAAAAPLAPAVTTPLAAPLPPPPVRRAPIQSPGLGLKTILHNYHHVVSGNLEEISEKGATLKWEAGRSDSSPFQKGMRVWLNLFFETDGKSENIQVQIQELIHRGTNWEFDIAWTQVPSLLS